jgi:hypothetical protein
MYIGGTTIRYCTSDLCIIITVAKWSVRSVVKPKQCNVQGNCLWTRTNHVTDLQRPPSERTQSDKIRDLKSLAKQYAHDQGSCDDTRISYLEYVESEAEADWTLARMIAG